MKGKINMKKIVILFFVLITNITFAQLTDSELIDTLQKDVLKYFWAYAHPVSKLSRERIHEDDLSFDSNTITTGGSGFGMMNIILGIENGFISRSAGVAHLTTAIDFLRVNRILVTS